MPERDQVFISYSHDDRKWLDELLTHLRPLVRHQTIQLSWDGLIEPGQKWHDEIRKYLETAKVAVLLVSPNFLASEFIYNEELPQILQNVRTHEVALFWCHVRPCLYQDSPVWEYQAAHNPDKAWSELSVAQRDRLLSEIARKLKEVYESQVHPEPRPAGEEFGQARTEAPEPVRRRDRDELLRLVSRLDAETALGAAEPAAGDDPFHHVRLILRDVDDPAVAAEVGNHFVLKRDWPNALFAFERMVDIATPGDKLSMALGYEHLGFTYRHADLAARACQCWRLSSHVYRRLGRDGKAAEVSEQMRKCSRSGSQSDSTTHSDSSQS